MIIYKLLRITEWQQLEVEKETLGAPIDLLDGYIHFSTKSAFTTFAIVRGFNSIVDARDADPPFSCTPRRFDNSSNG